MPPPGRRGLGQAHATGFTVQQSDCRWLRLLHHRPPIGKASRAPIPCARPRSPNCPRLDGSHLTLDEIVAVARRARAGPGRRRRRASGSRRRTRFADGVAEDRPIYGRSTGVGANREHGRCPTPTPRPCSCCARTPPARARCARPQRVRAMLRDPAQPAGRRRQRHQPRQVLDALEAMLAADALPPVREGGSVGTADLAALATTALVLCGEVPSTPPVPAPTEFGPGDALTFMSSNAAVLADAALAVADLDRLARSAAGHRGHGLRRRARQRRGVQPGRRGRHARSRVRAGSAGRCAS